MNVVLATDGSGHSRLAEAVLAKVLDPSKTKVTAVSVSAPIVVGMGTIAGGGVAAVGGLTELYDAVKVAAERFAEEATERLRGKGFDAEAVVLEGDAADTLIEFVERNDAHLVVIGSRGLGGIASFLLGSVARKLVSRCPSTVLIARAFEGMSPEESIEALNAKAELDAVVAIDGSDGSKVAMRWIQQRVSMPLAALHVVCAEPLGVIPAGIDPSAFAQVYEFDREKARELVAEAAEELAGRAPSIDTYAEIARPSTLIVRVAAETKSDLIAVGASRHGTLERILVGSVSYEVATSAPCSVVVVRPES
ncbi:MAG: hypothetical protein DCC46_09365 [Armatimonadetes bacterium]|nr:MAG: hypothetical protein DCC46_09365 [Armatimonadota bacterium]